MCGVIGVINPQRRNLSRRTLENLLYSCNLTLNHRGPDASGLYLDEKERFALAHTRLSIIDLNQAANQPLSVRNNPWILSFNGEIYNYKELRLELERNNCLFLTSSDTEVLLHLLNAYGTDGVRKIDGQFAFIAVNKESGEVICARDRFGEKPLYYFQENNFLVAASEISAFELIDIPLKIKQSTIEKFFLFQYIPDFESIYDGIKQLQPGEMIYRSSFETNFTFFAYHKHKFSKDKNQISYYESLEILKNLLLESLEKRIISSDRPVGLFLSSGVDSSLVAALTKKELGLSLDTYSLGFDDEQNSEHLIARKISESLGLKHKTLMLNANHAIPEFLGNLQNVMSEPLGDFSCVPTFFLSKFAKRDITVCVSGDGGDELFAGYDRYRRFLYEREQLGINSEYYGPLVLTSRLEDVLLNFGSISIETIRGLKEKQSQHGRNMTIDEMRETDLDNYLPGAVLSKVDRMAMANSLEVRTPFLNEKIFNFASKIPEEFLISRFQTKLILRDLLSSYIGKEFSYLPKRGFGFPSNNWGSEGLVSYLNEHFREDDEFSNIFPYVNTFRINGHQSMLDQSGIYFTWNYAVIRTWIKNRSRNITLIRDGEAVSKNQQFRNTSIACEVGFDFVTENPLKLPTELKKILVFRNLKNLWVMLSSLEQINKFKFFKDIKIRIFQEKEDALKGVNLIFTGDNYVQLFKGLKAKVLSLFLRLSAINSGKKILLKYFYSSLKKAVDNKRDEDSHNTTLVFKDFSYQDTRFFTSKIGLRRNKTFSLEGYVQNKIERRNGGINGSSTQRRVLLFTHALNSGGAEHQWVKLLAILRNLGYETKLLTYSNLNESNSFYLSKPQYKNLLSDHHINISNQIINKVSSWKNIYSVTSDELKFLSELVYLFDETVIVIDQFLKEYKPQIILSQLDEPNLLAGLLGINNNIPNIILSFRSVNPEKFHFISPDFAKFWYQIIIKDARTKLTSNSHIGAMSYADFLGIDERKIHYLPNYVEVHTSSKVTAETKFMSKTVLGAMRLSDEKDPFTFLRVAEYISLFHGHLGLRFNLFGDGPLWNFLVEYVNSKNLNNYISISKSTHDLSEVLNQSSLLLSTSIHEGTPNVILESVLSGNPVISTNAGDVGKIFGENNFFYDTQPGDFLGLAGKVISVMSDFEIYEAKLNLTFKLKQQNQKSFGIDSLKQALSAMLEDTY